ncbi:BspA family leucine-rich repeat surface protein [Lactiplantibacillus mudanjiangensis]|uniref:Gram-positive cocci surface proteins LPxTG domain-containing protein n=1 Tax=Lactiplantibacillus mudanjiangensis TaxID=1296538 RepID=A0A660E302_9LACO|nr:BspA family leucine-rich repeat surface protein [Lactiplantibacillus mudanjiangensis]VDG23778.1 hypothetical protein [Lactobacillus allii] [Lactiplantibacillus mudanjiangensis]VDG29716.1 hypothetical protein [Lactobacillus allii] [Lactiplantibacillus mudanjiangensis]
MNKKSRSGLEPKLHFKLYKSGKHWLVAGITVFAVGTGLTVGITKQANAATDDTGDTNTNTTTTTTSAAKSTSVTLKVNSASTTSAAPASETTTGQTTTSQAVSSDRTATSQSATSQAESTSADSATSDTNKSANSSAAVTSSTATSSSSAAASVDSQSPVSSAAQSAQKVEPVNDTTAVSSAPSANSAAVVTDVSAATPVTKVASPRMSRALMAVAVPTAASTQTFGTATWSLDANGVLTLGAGTLPAKGNFYPAPWYSSAADVKTVNITGKLIAQDTLASMFSGMTNLTTINGLNNLDTSHVTDMSSLFENDQSLTAIDLSSFDTSQVTNMNSMFHGDKSLTALDLSTFKTTKVTDMGGMFGGDSGLTALNVSGFDTSHVTDMFAMFSGVSGITTLDVSNFDTANVETMASMFYGIQVTDLNLSNFNTSQVTNMAYMFEDAKALTTLDLTSFDTSNVTNMIEMFSGASKLASLNVTSFNTAKVTSMFSMFYGDLALTSLDVSKFDTGNVTSMHAMFYMDQNLNKLDVSHFNTAKVTDMSDMFNMATSVDTQTALTVLDVSNFDTSSVTDMSAMFADLHKVTVLDVSNFNTQHVTDMESMFNGDTQLENLDVSHFDTGNVTTMSHMFLNDSSLLALDVSNFDTEKVTDMSTMFDYDGSLNSLNLASFTISTSTNLNQMLTNLTHLKVLVLGDQIATLNGAWLEDPEIPGSYWQNKATGTIEKPAGDYKQNSMNLIADYNPTMAETYIWTQAPVDVQNTTKTATRTIKYYDLDQTAGTMTLISGVDTVSQKVTYTQTALVDSYNHKLLGYDTNGDGVVDTTDPDAAWYIASGDSATFEAVVSPDLSSRGYQEPGQAIIAAKTPAFSELSNISLGIYYEHQLNWVPEYRTVMRTIDYQDENGNAMTDLNPVVQIANFKRSNKWDMVTNQQLVTGDWSSDVTEFGTQTSPIVTGYTTKDTEVAAMSVTADTENSTEKVIYALNDELANIQYVDMDANNVIVASDQVNGKYQTSQAYSTANKLATLAKQGYVLVNDGVPATITFDTDNPQTYTVQLKHRYQTLTPVDEMTPGTPIDPTDPNSPLYPDLSLDLSATTNRVIHYIYTDGNTAQPTVTQTVTATRTATVDLVTGTVVYGDWSKVTVPAQSTPVLAGYTADIAEVGSADVTAATGDLAPVTVTYTKNQVPVSDGTITVTYVDSTTGAKLTEKVLKGTVRTVADYHTTDTIATYQQLGYILEHDGYPMKATYTTDGQTYTVYLAHGMKVVTPNDGTKLDLTKTVTQTIHYVYDNGQTAVPDKVTTRTFTRQAIVDLVTGTTTYGSWQLTTNDSEFPATTSPSVSGYTADQTVSKVVAITAESADDVQTVTYTGVVTPQAPSVPSDPQLPSQPAQPGTTGEQTATVIPQTTAVPRVTKVVAVKPVTVTQSIQATRPQQPVTVATAKINASQPKLKVSVADKPASKATLPQTSEQSNHVLASVLGLSLATLLGSLGLYKKQREEK